MRPLSLLCVAALAVACGDPAATPPDGASSDAPAMTIGPAGGTLELGGVRIVVPAGALEEPVAITVEVGVTAPVALPASHVPISTTIRVQPHGLTFAAPVTITLPVTAATSGAPAAQFLADEVDTTWEQLAGATVTASTVAFETSHFSYMVVTVPAQSSACSPACTGTDVCVGGSCVAAIANPCGPAAGYAPNSPWPTRMGCETNRRQTWAIGPATQPVLKWRWDPTKTVNQAATFGPVIDASGALYMVNVYDVVKLSPQGTELWRVPLIAGNNQIQGQLAGTLVADGNLVVAAPFQVKTKKLDAATGATLWEADLGCAIPYTPAADGTLWCGNQRLVGATGQKLADPPEAACSSVTVLDGQGDAYCVKPDGLAGMTSSGAEKWKSNLDFNHSVGSQLMLGTYQSSPVVAAAIYNFMTTPNHWYGLYPLAGPGTTKNDPSVPRHPVLSQGAAAMTSTGDIATVRTQANVTTGALEMWPQSLIGTANPAASWASTSAAGAEAVVIDGNGNLYYGTRDGFLVSYTSTGTPRWSVRVGQSDSIGVLSHVAIGPDGTIYVVGQRTSQTNSYLYALAAP